MATRTYNVRRNLMRRSRILCCHEFSDLPRFSWVSAFLVKVAHMLDVPQGPLANSETVTPASLTAEAVEPPVLRPDHDPSLRDRRRRRQRRACLKVPQLFPRRQIQHVKVTVVRPYVDP